MMGNSRIKCRNLAEVFTVSEIRYMQMDDKEFWYSLDRHLSEEEFRNKIQNKRGYILLENEKPREREISQKEYEGI